MIGWSTVVPEKAAPVTGTTSRATGPVPADSRQHICMVITYSGIWINLERFRIMLVVSCDQIHF